MYSMYMELQCEILQIYMTILSTLNLTIKRHLIISKYDVAWPISDFYCIGFSPGSTWRLV